jgi:MFS family permease
MILPPMQQSLGLDNAGAGILATANLVGYLALSVVGGVLATRYGPRRVVTVGLLATGAGMLLTATTHGLITAAAWRALTGLGSGASNIAAMGLLSSWFGQQRRGLASGIASAGSSLGIILLGPLIPWLLRQYGASGWRLAWQGFGAVTLLAAVASYVILRDRPEERGVQPIGMRDSLLAGDGNRRASPSGQRSGWAKIYHSSIAWHLGFVYAAFGFGYIIYMTFFTRTLLTNGLSEDTAGRLFMVVGWCSLLCGLIWGSLSDTIGRRRSLIIGYLMHGAAFAMFALWRTPTGFTTSAVVFGLSAWTIPTVVAATCGDLFGPRLAPAALGFVTIFFGIGQAVSPSIAGALADATGSFAPTHGLAAGVALLGALGAALLRSGGEGV